MKKILLPFAILATMAYSGEQFAMSDADIYVESGGELFDELGGEEVVKGLVA